MRQAGQLERLADHPAELLRVERLEQVIVGPLLHGLDGRVGGGGGGDEDHRDAGVDPADVLVDFQPGEVGQAHVEQDHLGGALANRASPSAPLRATSISTPRGPEGVPYLGLDQAGVVVYEQ